MSSTRVNICWFRRDLRLHDQAALYYALREGLPVLPVFIFDRHILDQLEDRDDRRVSFIHAALQEMQSELVSMGSSLHVYYGLPEEIFPELLERYEVSGVYASQDYEPYALERDEKITAWLKGRGVPFHGCKDHVLLEKSEVVKDDGKPYTVFTPYSKRFRSVLNDFHLKAYPTEKYFENFLRCDEKPLPALEQMGFVAAMQPFPSKSVRKDVVTKYAQQRDYPAMDGTTRIGVHLRFGTISIRELAKQTMAWSDTYMNELIWREFYQMILWHFPQVGRGKAFRTEYDRIEWRNDEGEFERWCTGRTGYPIVDAGMRELNETGYMHNRVRMIVASFLSKHLLIDWRWGEAYFARKLLDFELASNNGGWQWAAGSGCDAAPYFRVFNPTLQTQKFDPALQYIKKWVPELNDFGYPSPVVVHEFARKRCLEVYGAVLKKGE